VEFHPITGTFGTEVTDIDLTAQLSGSDLKELQVGFVEHKVLVFPGQIGLTPAAHVRFGRLFGDLEIHPFHPRLEDYPEVTVLETAGIRESDSWHSDVTFRENPSIGSILKPVKIPPTGRDTLFADMSAAYEGMSSKFQRLLGELTALHDWRHIFVNGKDEGDLPPAEHPVVTKHPVSGRRILFVNPTFTTKIVGMKPTESRALLEVAFAQIRIPEYQLRVRWAPGTIAMWDNRSTQHALVFDNPDKRIMHRVTLAGEVPV
jgi:taurine dioxygenase